MRPISASLIATCSFLLTACGLFDSGTEWRGGPYELTWIDTGENVSISYSLGDGTAIDRIKPTVFAVGWDGRYLVAKQHPGNDRKVTNYYIIDSKKDGRLRSPSEVVDGPLSQVEFSRKAAMQGLPEFDKTLTSLE